MEINPGAPTLETRLIHGPQGAVEEEGATLPPLYYSTSFDHASAAAMEAVFAGREAGNLYSRLQNPTVKALETRITDAAGARGTLAVASGMSAIALALLALLRSGDELLAGRYLFGGSYSLFHRTLAELGITVHFFDPRDPEAAAALVTPRTRAIYLEAIANPAMVVPDFAAYRRLCDAHGLPLLADATLPTPCLFDGAALGVDVALFSASKYMAGPASTLGGLIVDTGRFDWLGCPHFDFSDFRDAPQGALLGKLRSRLMAGVGPSLAPMNAFLLLLGLETLPLRMERHAHNAQAAATFLREHPQVGDVLYPGLPDSEFHDLTRAQFQGNCGGMITFRLADKAHCFNFLDRLKLVRRAVNLGDTKSIALHPASTIYGTYWPDEQALLGVTDDMIRFSVGLETPADLLGDLDQALRG